MQLCLLTLLYCKLEYDSSCRNIKRLPADLVNYLLTYNNVSNTSIGCCRILYNHSVIITVGMSPYAWDNPGIKVVL